MTNEKASVMEAVFILPVRYRRGRDSSPEISILELPDLPPVLSQYGSCGDPLLPERRPGDAFRDVIFSKGQCELLEEVFQYIYIGIDGRRSSLRLFPFPPF